MKKNIFSVIITVVTVINVVLTAIMFFVMLPTFQKSNTLITQVASVLNLELDADADADADANYTLKDLENTTAAFEEDQTVNLKDSGDGKQHFGVFSGYTVGVNKNADDYSDFKTDFIAENQSAITDIIRTVMQNHSYEDCDEALIKKEALAELQDKFDTKAIVQLTLDNFKKQ